MRNSADRIFDSLYGTVELDNWIRNLTATPIVQRLRHVRLSNIDSLDIPGIANLSRYEHVLGVCHLTTEAGLFATLTQFDRLVVAASALLHDVAITAFGHLVEEAFQYSEISFDHEGRLHEILVGHTPEEIGGLQRQILGGRETGLEAWARGVTSSYEEGSRLISEITDHIQGRGKAGQLISGDIDLDNIDNVFRMAYHIGLNIDRNTPLRLARALVGIHEKTGGGIFHNSAVKDIDNWLQTRKDVYSHLMMAPRDFIGKVMMLYAATRALAEGELTVVDWALTDRELVERFLGSNSNDIKETITRWIVGELWDATPLVWMEGDRPEYPALLEFSNSLSSQIGRKCFAYGIKDKRDRELAVHLDDGRRVQFGRKSHRWILGIASSTRRKFTVSDNSIIFDYASSYFNTKIIGPATSDGGPTRQEAQPCLF